MNILEEIKTLKTMVENADTGILLKSCVYRLCEIVEEITNKFLEDGKK